MTAARHGRRQAGPCPDAGDSHMVHSQFLRELTRTPMCRPISGLPLQCPGKDLGLQLWGRFLDGLSAMACVESRQLVFKKSSFPPADVAAIARERRRNVGVGLSTIQGENETSASHILGAQGSRSSPALKLASFLGRQTQGICGDIHTMNIASYGTKVNVTGH